MSYLSINFHNINYIFSAISFFPLILFLKIVVDLKIYLVSKFNYYFLISILFFPSLHFWVSGFSKDTVCFFAIFFIIYIFLKEEFIILKKIKLNYLMFYLFFLILTLSFVRPHIGLLAIFSISLLFIFKNFFLSNSKNYIILFLLIFTLLISFFSTFGTFDLNKISKFIKIFADYITPDTSTQFPTELNYFTKILYYFFYPIYFSI